MSRYLNIIILVITMFTVFVGCYDRIELDDMSYVMAVGIDKDKMGLIELTLQIAIPSKIEEDAGEDSVYMERIKTTDIVTGINTVNNIKGKIINLSHVKTIVFSKEIAQNDIKNYISEIIREKDFRPSINILVSEVAAHEYLNSLISSPDSNSVQVYELSSNTYLQPRLTENTTLHDFHIGLGKENIQVVTALVDSKKPIGIAIFNNGTMVGRLNEKESIYYSIMSGESNEYIIPMTNLINEEKGVAIKLTQTVKPTYSLIEFSNNGNKNDMTRIRINLKVDAQILSNKDMYFSINASNQNLIKKEIEQQITNDIIEYLKHTKSLGADINGLGEIVKKRFLTLPEWEAYNWSKRYKDLQFDVNVSVNMKTML